MSQPVPGSAAIQSFTPNDNIFYKPGADHPWIDDGRIDATYAIDGANTGRTDYLKAGTIMARITASRLWVPCKRTQVNGATTNSASFVVDNARHFKVGDTVTAGAVTGLTITAIDYATNEITTDDAGTLDCADNAVVFASGGLAGAEVARAVLASDVDLYDCKLRGTRDMYVGNLISGHCRLLADALLGDITAMLAATHKLGAIQFYRDGVQI